MSDDAVTPIWVVAPDPFGRFNQRSGAGKVKIGRVFHRRKVQTRAIQTYGCGGNQHVTDVNVWLDSAGGADTQEGPNPQLRQFFNGDGR